MSDITPSDSLVLQASNGPAQAASSLADSINKYLGGQLQQNQDLQTEAGKAAIEVEKQKQIAQNNQNITNPSSGQQFVPLDPNLAEKALPGYGAKMVQDYNSRNPQNPLSLNQGLDYITKAQQALQAANPNKSDDEKIDAHQDQLEKQAMDRITQVRGDQSLIKTEAQRDAAAMAYETITKAQSEGRHLSSVEYNDLAAQLWKARTGASVTTQELQKLAPPTAQTSADHLAAWASGNPNLIGTTSTDTENNLKQFVADTGQMADKQHDAYMNPRMIKPTGLEQTRWDRIAASARGLSFSEQKKVSDTTHPINSDTKKISGVSKSGKPIFSTDGGKTWQYK